MLNSRSSVILIHLFFSTALSACSLAPDIPQLSASQTPISSVTASEVEIVIATESPPQTAATADFPATANAPDLPTQLAETSNVSTFSEWSKRAPLPEPNSEIAVTELDGKIYVLGGYPSTRVTVGTVQVYDTATDMWSLVSPLPVPINHTVAAAANGKIYVLGGQSSAAGGGPFLSTVFEFDPQTNEWTLKSPMPTARGGGAAAVVDGKIYVAGGRPPQGNDFAVYDPVLDEWAVLPDMPTARNHIAAAAIDGKIYVVGGRFGAGFQSELTNVLEVYDPQSESWTTVAPMPTVRSGLNGIAANGCFHVFGGEGSGGVFPQHEVYDPITNTWFTFLPLPTPVHGVTGSAFVNGWIHLPGGGTEVGGSSGSTIHQVMRVEMVCE